MTPPDGSLRAPRQWHGPGHQRCGRRSPDDDRLAVVGERELLDCWPAGATFAERRRGV